MARHFDLPSGNYRKDVTPPVDACEAGTQSDVIDLQSIEGEIDVRGESAVLITLVLNGDNTSTQIIGPGADKLKIARSPLVIEGDTTVVISGLTWADSHAHTWAAIRAAFGVDLKFDSVRLTENTGFHGGAISVMSSSLEIIDSEISHNFSRNDGGAIRADPDVPVSITNSTISSNFARGWGGGVHCRRCNLTIDNSTITHNKSRAPFGTGIHIEDFNGPSNTVIRDSIVANNFIGELDGEIQGRSDLGAFTNGHGHFGSIEYSIIDIIDFLDTTQYQILSSLLDDQVDYEELNIQPLCFNGGATRTHIMSRGSVAHDFGDPAFAGLDFDQRGPGYPRVLNGRLDAGAIEFDPALFFEGGFEDLTENELCNLAP